MDSNTPQWYVLVTASEREGGIHTRNVGPFTTESRADIAADRLTYRGGRIQVLAVAYQT